MFAVSGVAVVTGLVPVSAGAATGAVPPVSPVNLHQYTNTLVKVVDTQFTSPTTARVHIKHTHKNDCQTYAAKGLSSFHGRASVPAAAFFSTYT